MLIDFGYSAETIRNNLVLLGIDPRTIDAAVLSHGHLDHDGGFPGFFGNAASRRIPLFVGGEEAFCERLAMIGDVRSVRTDHPLDGSSLNPTQSLTVPYFLAAIAAVAVSDAIAILPAGLLKLCGSNVSAVSLPNDGGFAYRLIWHRRVHDDDVNVWLRERAAQSMH